MKKANRLGIIAIGLAVATLWGFAGCEYYNERPVQADLPTTQDIVPPSDTEIAGDKTAVNTDKDTDGDGVTDADEVNLYGTDPLNPDTDGDGYPDGTEIKSGYNPLGADKCTNPDCTDQTPPPPATTGNGLSDRLKQAGLQEEKNKPAAITEDSGLGKLKDRIAVEAELEFKKDPTSPFAIDPNAKPEDKPEEELVVTGVKLGTGVWYRSVKVGDDHHSGNQYMYPKKDRIALRCPTEGKKSEDLTELEAPGQFHESSYAVIGAEVGYLKYGAYLGSDYDGDQSDSDVEDIRGNSGTVNIRNINLVCGKLDENGIHTGERKDTPWVGQTDNYYAVDFSDNEGPMDDIGLDHDPTQMANWGYHEKGHIEGAPMLGSPGSVGGPVKNNGKNEIVIGVRFRTWDAKDSYARLSSICENESYEPVGCDCADWEESRAWDDPTRGGGTRQEMSVNDCASAGSFSLPWNGTPANPTVITSIEFITVPFNPKGDPTKKTGPDAIMDYSKITPSGTFFPKEYNGLEAKGEKTKEFLCYDPDMKHPVELRNAALTGMVVRTNWFYGVTYVDTIECKWITQKLEAKGGRGIIRL